MDAYDEYYEAAGPALRAGSSARDAHRAVAKGFLDRGFHLGHVTGHSIGMTMIEFPKIGEADDTELEAGMVLSMHPHAIAQDGKACLYMQDTWLVTGDGGVPLADLPMKIYDGTERRPG
jgi:Xaa-Pro dipeptidase